MRIRPARARIERRGRGAARAAGLLASVLSAVACAGMSAEVCAAGSEPAAHATSVPAARALGVDAATGEAAGAIVRAAPATDRTYPRRIVSLAPSITETLFAIGAGDAVVAISTHCDRPPEALALPRSGTYLAPDVETILALEPDLVIGMPTPTNRAPIEQLRGLGLAVVLVGEDSLADSLQAMRTIGRVTGRSVAAERLVHGIRGDLDRVRALAASRPRVRTLLLVGRDPPVAAGRGGFVDELLTIAGGDNAAGDALGEWPRLSLEAIAAARPEIVIDTVMEPGRARFAEGPVEGEWRAVAVVAETGFARLPSDALLRPGPRLGVAARELFGILHGAGGPSAPAAAVLDGVGEAEPQPSRAKSDPPLPSDDAAARASTAGSAGDG